MKSDQIKIEVCFHEAGHWIVARHLNFKIGEVRITIKKDGGNFGHSGSARIFPRLESNSNQSIEKYLRDRIAVLFAGVISQTLSIKNNSTNTARNLLESDGADDYKTINELFYILRGVCYPGETEYLNEEQILQLQKECWEYSDKIVQSLKSDISKLAHKMAKEVISVNKEYIFEHRTLTSWLTNLSPKSDAPSDF